MEVIDPDVGFGLVSDIDDTVMVTALPRPLLAAWHTFVVNEHARTTTPGMPVLYERLTSQHPGAPVIYLSTGAWNAAPAIGRFLRRYSLDELVQLVNVLNGSMSLVGPRPPLAREVESYETKVHRRFLVKPGITGTWQVSGRSSLSWEESVRLDLSYVENWTLVGDLIIIARTAKAMIVPGATAH